MRYEYCFAWGSDESTKKIHDFIQTNSQYELFIELGNEICKEIPDLVLRGDAQIIGISKPGQRYAFYVVPNAEGFTIKFRSQEKSAFSESNEKLLRQMAYSEIQNMIVNPDAYLIMTSHQTRSNVQTTPRISPYGKTPLHEEFGVNAEKFIGIQITCPPFTKRSRNCLLHAGLTDVCLLLKKSETELLGIQGFGNNCLQDVKNLLGKIIAGDPLVAETIRLASTESIPTNTRKKIPTPNYQSYLVCGDIWDALSRATTLEMSEAFSPDTYATFLALLDDWASRLFDAAALTERQQDMFKSRVLIGETLNAIGERYGLSRERIRQICLKSNRIVVSKARRASDEKIVTVLNSFLDVIFAVKENELCACLKYVMENRRPLWSLILSIFVPPIERDNFRQAIESTSIPAEEHAHGSKEQRTEKNNKPKETKLERKPPIPSGSHCPRCGAELVIRTTVKGKNAGKRFLGCSTFPNCYYYKALTSSLEEKYKALLNNASKIADNN